MNFTKGITLALVFSAITVTGRAQVSFQESLSRWMGLEGSLLRLLPSPRRLNAPGGVIAVVDEGGNLMALERLDGTFAAGANISIGKARTAVIFKKPTKVFEDIIKNGRTPMIALNDFTPLQGGVPVLVDGEVIGGVGVSGAASARQDEELAIAGANAAKDFANSGNVSFLRKAKSEGCFCKRCRAVRRQR